MRTWRFGLAVIILLAMVGIGVTNLVRVSNSSGVGPLDSTIAAASQPDGPLTMEAAYVTALTQARTWSPTSTLMYASLQADWPLDPQEAGPAAFPPGGWVRFAFVDRAGSKGKLLSIVIERYSGEIVTTDVQAWGGTMSSQEQLPVARTAMTSEQALLIAELAYGQAFRLQCPIARHETDVTLVEDPDPATPPLIVPGPTIPGATTVSGAATPQAATPISATPTMSPSGAQSTYWLVTYRDGTQPGVNTIEMKIDATTGDIQTISDRSQGCTSPSG